MPIINLPYGNTQIVIRTNPGTDFEVLLPHEAIPEMAEQDIVKIAINNPVSGKNLLKMANSRSKVVITVNDKTRPVPNHLLLPPLLKRLHESGVIHENVIFLIASGTHIPMKYEEFNKILPPEVLSKYEVVSHDCDDASKLVYAGKTTAGTPVYINKLFIESDMRIVVGDIEPHHFAGYSGGVKSAAVGVCGRQTINSNHALLQDPRSTVARFEDNPLRMDIESIGGLIKVDLALNAVLNERKEIVACFFGRPNEVIKEGIRVVNQNCQISIREKYDLVIASAGGYPKDINFYQSQKAMTHASLFCKEKGDIVLVAECCEGVGSSGYLNFMEGVRSTDELLRKFAENGFSVGPHKAFLTGRILQKHKVFLHSSLPSEIIRSLLLYPIDLNGPIFWELVKEIHDKNGRIAVLPYATACIPKLDSEEK